MVNCSRDFNCSNHAKDLHANPTSVTCSGDQCTADECCTVTRTTSDNKCPANFSCGTGKILKANPTTISCSSATCSPTDCCSTTCPTDFQCGTGKVKKDNLTTIACSSSECNSTDCCKNAPASNSSADIIELKKNVASLRKDITNIKKDIKKIKKESESSWFDWSFGKTDEEENFTNKNHVSFFILVALILFYFVTKANK